MTNCTRQSSHAFQNILSALVCFTLITACNSATIPDDGPNAGQRLQVGEATTCAIAGNGAMWCWGEYSTFLQYGKDSLFQSSSPRNTQITGLANMANGLGQHMCGMSSRNFGRCWGRSGTGQLGSEFARTPGDTILPLPFGNWINISVGRVTTCGVTNQNIAYCWGANSRGEGGNSTRPIGEIARTPRGVESTRDFKDIAAGWIHTCAITVLGEALCWGDNSHGQLGIGAADTTARRLPLVVQTNIRFEQISAGALYTCAISTDHSAYCWGNNATGNLGDGTTTSRATPTLVAGGLKFKRIITSSGFDRGTSGPIPDPPGISAHTCALTESNTAYCWGLNASGQLGDGTLVNRLVPTAVTGGKTFTELGAGGSHTCGMSSGVISCWGANAFGQLGTGNTTNSSTPLLVGAPFNANN